MTASPFNRLSAFFDFGASETLLQILAMVMSAGEAEILLALPGTPSAVAQELSCDVEELTEKLDDLY